MPIANSTNVTDLMAFVFEPNITNSTTQISVSTSAYLDRDPILITPENTNNYLTLPMDNGFGGCEFGQKVLFKLDQSNECLMTFNTQNQCTTVLNAQ